MKERFLFHLSVVIGLVFGIMLPQVALSVDESAQSSVALSPVFYPYYAWNPFAFQDAMSTRHLEFALAHSAAIRDLMDRERASHEAFMDYERDRMLAQSEATRRNTDAWSDWRRWQSDAWHRWVDPWGAARRDWLDARHQYRDNIAEQRREYYDQLFSSYVPRDVETSKLEREK